MSDQWGQQPGPNQQPWGQQPPYNSGQQPPFNPGQFQPLQPQQKKRTWLWITLGILGGALVLCGIIAVIGSSFSSTSNASNTGTITVAQTATPTKTQAQIEAAYKASTKSITVTNLDKDGSADKGKEVHFTSKIVQFVKDSTGKTAGANVSDADTSYSSSLVQVAFTPGTDITRLNQGDILEVWGTDQGVFSGTNAFGGTVQEVGITAHYMEDQTTKYQANTYTGSLATSNIALQEWDKQLCLTLKRRHFVSTIQAQ